MPTLIYYDQPGYTSAVREGAWLADKLTDLVAAFAALAWPQAAPVATADLPALLTDPAAWLLARALGTTGPLALGHLPISPQKALELVDKPEGFDAFVAEAQQAGQFLRQSHLPLLLRQPTAYAVDQAGQVALTTAAQQQLRQQHTHYATTPGQEALLKDLNALCTTLNRLRGGALAGAELVTEGALRRALVLPTPGSADPIRPNPAFIGAYAR